MEISITWNICRVCLQEQQKAAKESNAEQMKNIFNEDKKLAQHIYDFSGIFMQPNDSLPDKICLKCLKMINNAVQFRKTCRASNIYLQSILERTKSASTLFKPEPPACAVSDDEAYEENMETEATHDVPSDHEHSTAEKHKECAPPENQHNIQQKVKQTVEHVEEQLEENVVEEAVSDNTIELEEIIEHSEEMSEQIFTHAIEDSADKIMANVKEKTIEVCNVIDENVKAKPSQLQKFYMNASFTKFRNAEEELEDHNLDNEEPNLAEDNVEADINNLKANNEELYYLLKDIKNENLNSSDSHEVLEEPEENIEYYAIEDDEELEEDIVDEDIMLHLEEKLDDNQAQVSSTVDTNDEIEYEEQNSNASNIMSDLDEEYIVDDNFGTYHQASSQETTVSKSHTNRSGAKSSAEKRTSPVILPMRKFKRDHRKSSATSSTTAGQQLQVCVCEICGNQFTNRNLMNLHMKVHYQEKNHQCELCLKRFITACNLQAHMRIHTGEKPFECRYCGRRFNDRSSSLRHERTHTNEKPFKCDNCGKTFTLATTLQNHMKVHTNERSYRCEPCGKSFKLPHHLKTHQNTSLHRSVLQIGVQDSN